MSVQSPLYPPKADMCSAPGYVCFGPKADRCGAQAHVRFLSPTADGLLLNVNQRDVRFGPKADKHGRGRNVRFVPITDIIHSITSSAPDERVGNGDASVLFSGR